MCYPKRRICVWQLMAGLAGVLIWSGYAWTPAYKAEQARLEKIYDEQEAEKFAREEREWKARHPGKPYPAPVSMVMVSRRDPLVETPLGVMRSSQWDQLRKEELERRKQQSR